MTEATQASAETQKLDGLTDNETSELQYIDKRTDKGLNPGVTNANVNPSQVLKPNDPGVPKTPVEGNVKPPVELTEAQKAEAAKAADDKAKIAEAEAAALKDKQAEEAKKADEANKPDVAKQIEEAEYVKYNDPAADAAVEMLREKGIDAKESASWFKAVLESGDINKMDIAAMEAKLGKNQAQLVATAVKDYYTRQMQTIQTTTKAVTEVLGGDAAMKQVQTWVGNMKADHAQAKEVADLIAMMDRGEYSAKVAAKELKALFESDPNNKSLTLKQVSGDGVESNTGDTILTKQEYLKEMKVAQAAGNTARIAELRSNRARAHR